ncbi:MAG: methylthioribulose 1-phosphate dehydratase, partial [Bacteroidota bacterium]
SFSIILYLSLMNESPFQQSLHEELIELIRLFHQRGWSLATSTNYSFRNPQQDTITITSSGLDKSKISPGDLMIIDKNGEAIEGFLHLKPSAETLIHTFLYEDTQVNAILHTHSWAGTVLSRFFQSQGKIRMAGYEVLKGLSGLNTHQSHFDLPIFENSQDMIELCERLREYDQKKGLQYGFLLAGHGLYTWGNSIAEAKRHMETLEFLMECEYRMMALKAVQVSP